MRHISPLNCGKYKLRSNTQRSVRLVPNVGPELRGNRQQTPRQGGIFVLWIVLVIKAYQGQEFQLPVISDLAVQWH